MVPVAAFTSASGYLLSYPGRDAVLLQLIVSVASQYVTIIPPYLTHE